MDGVAATLLKPDASLRSPSVGESATGAYGRVTAVAKLLVVLAAGQ